MRKRLLFHIKTYYSLAHCPQVERFPDTGEATEIIGFGHIFLKMPGINLSVFQ